jgi:hypothetical protein
MSPTIDTTYLTGLYWMVPLLLLLIGLQRLVNGEIIAVLLLLTRSNKWTIWIFSFLFLPGVFLHELSHWIMAKVLGVRTGRVSLIPKLLPDGTLRMGFVEIYPKDHVREALIGLAPLIFGGIAVAFIGLTQLELDLVWGSAMAGIWDPFVEVVRATMARPYFWWWFYALFVVSNTMMPSPSDRRAWLPIILFIVILVFMTIGLGAGPWLFQTTMPALNQAMLAMATVFGTSAVIHALLYGPIWLFRGLLNRITGLEVRTR